MERRVRHPETNELISKAEYNRFIADQREREELERLREQAEADEEAERRYREEEPGGEPPRESWPRPLPPPQIDPWPPASMRRRQWPEGEPPGRYDDDAPTGNPQARLMGCMLVMMFLFMVIMAGAFAWYVMRTPATPVAPTPAVVPAGNLAALVAPIAAKLEHDPAKAREVYRVHAGLAEALQGPSGKRITDTRVMEAAVSALLRDAEVTGGVSVSNEIQQAVAAHLGIEWGSDGDSVGWEFKQFTAADQTKLAEITAAIAKAVGDTL